jgi:hypothetical protein
VAHAHHDDDNDDDSFSEKESNKTTIPAFLCHDQSKVCDLLEFQFQQVVASRALLIDIQFFLRSDNKRI